MEKCTRCGKNDNEVRIFYGFYVNDTVTICERCAILENIPMIKRPTASQLKESEKPVGVRERLSRMIGIPLAKKKEKTQAEEIKELQARSEKELGNPEELVFKLIDNFHWQILTNRRRKCLTQKQLAETIGESEAAIKLLEKGVVPGKSLDLINKLEQFFGINLVKKDIIEKIEEQRKIERKISSTYLKNREQEKKDFEDKMKLEEGEDMLTEAIITEKNPRIREKEIVEGIPLRAREFKKEVATTLRISDLKKIDQQIEKDFTKKSRQEVGEEQFEGFGKEDTEKLKGVLEKQTAEKKKEIFSKSKTPSIYDLMKEKEERDKGLTGKDIELVKEK